LSALEQRLHDAEALLGAIISSNDSRATTLVSDLSNDPLAGSIISRVTNSSFGPVGRNVLRQRNSKPNSRRRSINLRQEETNDQEAPMIDVNGHLIFTSPSNTWQDYLNLRLATESRSRSQAVSKSFVQDAYSTSLRPYPLSDRTSPKPPPLSTAFGDRVPSRDDGDTSAMNIDLKDEGPSLSSGKMAICQDSPNKDDGDDASSISTPRSQSTLAVDLGDAREGMEDSDHPYNLAHSLGLDSGQSNMCYDYSKSPVPRQSNAEDQRTDLWTRLIVAGEQSPSFDRDPSGLNTHDLERCISLAT